MIPRRLLAILWTSPNTLLGGLLVALNALARGRTRVVDGVIEAHGPALEAALGRLAQGPRALTLGHVVLGVSQAALDDTRAHERVHVAQYERWGPLFLPAYLAASGWCRLRARHPYADNPFEREAFAKGRADPPDEAVRSPEDQGEGRADDHE